MIYLNNNLLISIAIDILKLEIIIIHKTFSLFSFIDKSLDKSYGFIKCHDTYNLYKRDNIFINKSEYETSGF